MNFRVTEAKKPIRPIQNRISLTGKNRVAPKSDPVFIGQLQVMHSQKVMRWLSKNFDLQGVVVFQG
ncbi:MAG: hypothetical protein BA864_08275 [Desulfuromonadales bacterium C00003093]|nr:MAG: hypothetical protein BA864_08275 [Desulfuromonadales bacterium C00003093]